MNEARPLFIWFLVVVVTLVFALLYVSLPETIEGASKRSFREPKFTGKQVKQRPMLVGVWLAIVVPLAAFGVVVTRRES